MKTVKRVEVPLDARFNIRGRGLVFVVKGDFSIGDQIEVDNEVYEIRSLELSTPMPRDGKFGICVRKVNGEV